MEIWKPFNIANEPTLKRQIEIANNTESLNAIFKQANKNIIAQYTGGWYSYKVTISIAFEEKIKFLRQHKKINIPQDVFIFKVENSDYLQWLKEESYGVYEYGNFKMEHFVFIGSNIVFEVLATCEPTIKIVPH